MRLRIRDSEMNPRVSRRTAVLGGLLIVACSLCAAQSLTGQKILEQCARNYDEVKDYIVDLTADVNMERLRMPQMKATLYFKSPDKFYFESPGFAMLPREGFGLPVTMLLKRYNATLEGEEMFEGAATYKIHLVAKDPAAQSQQMFLWVRKDHFTIARTETVPYQGRSVAMRFSYRLEQGKFWLPDTMSVELTVPPVDSLDTGGEGQMPGVQQFRGMRRPLRNGTITVVYSNYRINTGLSDEFFQRQRKEGQ